ncbi:MAG: acyltransferase [Bacteroidetes bacterium]|nr:acyltransferase [Bacteroidota bacterium]
MPFPKHSKTQFSINTTKHIYFSGLNGLRFFAALAVVITHIELLKGQYSKPNLWNDNKLIFELGGLGVVFFFVLSGFLITFLLLKEKENSGTISIMKFYTRRILRIWPLYFLLMIIGFFVIPLFPAFNHVYFTPFFKESFWSNFLLYLFILPNLALAMFKPVPHIGQLWSIGVEEQFYLIWPWLVKHSKNLLRILVIVIAVCLLLKFLFQMLVCYNPENDSLIKVKTFIATLKFESMAIGGIGAWCVYNKKYLDLILNNTLMFASLFMILISVYFTPGFIQDGVFILQSVLFLIVIINVSSNPNTILKLENKMFVFLGNISYGIYMYHMIMIVAVMLLMEKLGIAVDNSLLSQFLIYSLSVGLTILVSWLSYRYFETYFIKLKKKVTVVSSGSTNH